MSKPTTEIILLLDSSGSMKKIQLTAGKALKAVVEEQRHVEEDDCYIEIWTFAYQPSIVKNATHIDKIKHVSYPQCGGGTALYRSLYETSKSVRERQERNGPPDKTLFVVMSDGKDSCQDDRLPGLIKTAQEEWGWEYLYLGADISEETESDMTGIHINQVCRWRPSANGLETLFEQYGIVLSSARIWRNQPLSDTARALKWKDKVEGSEKFYAD